MTLKFLPLILVLGFFSACEQLTGSKDDPARAIQQIPDPIPVPPPPLSHPEPPPPILPTTPIVSFAFAEWAAAPTTLKSP